MSSNNEKVILCPEKKDIIPYTECFKCGWLYQISYEHGWVECEIEGKRHFNSFYSDPLDPELLKQI